MKIDKINILHVYQNSKIGGIQNQILHILGGYDKDRFNPAFCCLGPPMGMREEMEKRGIDFIALNRKRYSKFSPGIILDLYRLIKKKNVHIIRTHKYRSNFYGRIAAWLARVPVIISSEHNIYVYKEKRLVRRITNYVLSGITDLMVAVSDAVAKDLIKYDGIDQSKIITLHNGVDTDRFDGKEKSINIRLELRLGINDFVLGFIGRLVPNKGLHYLIDEVSILKKEHDNIKLLIVGDGSLIDSLKRKVKKLDLIDNVQFAGERRDIVDILSCIDIFVMPSVKEGLPNALLEAMAMRRPVIATNIGGIPEVVENNKTGILIESGKPKALAESVKRLKENGELARSMGNEARIHILDKFSIVSAVEKWQSLYVSLLEDKGFTV